MKEEFEAVGAPPFEDRGRVTDEYLQAFKILWTEENPHFEGRHVRFAEISFLQPVQKPHPPIWIGGESPPALRRTVRYGDVWFPIGNNPHHPLDTVAHFKAGVENVHQVAEQNNRDPKTIGLAFYAGWFDEAKPAARVENGERHIMTGSAAQVAEDIAALSELGVTDLVLNLQRGTLEQSLASMQHFAAEIRPLSQFPPPPPRRSHSRSTCRAREQRPGPPRRGSACRPGSPSGCE